MSRPDHNLVGSATGLRLVLPVLLLFCVTILPGCLAHGDAVARYRMRGQVVDASTQQPLANARVWAMPDGALPLNRQETVDGLTEADGSFTVKHGRGIGSVTWIILVPIYQGPWQLPPVDTVALEVQHEGKTGSALVHRSADCQQPESRGGRRIELGTISVTLEAAPTLEPTIAGSPERAPQ
jgi:hypothetical protein